MKTSLNTLFLLGAVWFAQAQGAKETTKPDTKAVAGKPASSPAASKQGATPAPVAEDSPILKAANLKTEWKDVRNPFRFEVVENKQLDLDHYEEIQVNGFTKMPDEREVLRTYAFLTKTTERQVDPSEEKKNLKQDPKQKAKTVAIQTETIRDNYLLQAIPEILDESTTPTEEQIENSSIVLGNETLWFVGVITTTNRQSIAVFWPYGTYPVKEDSLRRYEIHDDLKDLVFRNTPRGEKIGGSSRQLSALSRPRKTGPATGPKAIPASGKVPPAVAPTANPPPKPTINTSLDKAMEDALKNGKAAPAAGPKTSS